MPEAFLAQLPVAAYPDVSEEKTSGTQGTQDIKVLANSFYLSGRS